MSGITSLHLDGEQLAADVVQVITAADYELTIEGASTVTISIRDPDLIVLRSGLFDKRVSLQFSSLSFELAQVRKQGRSLSLIFEDLAVAALRRHDTPRKVAAGVMTHVDFARQLVAEEPWIQFISGPGAERSKAELTRGQVAEAAKTPEGKPKEAKPEDTWAALGRIADDRGWRRFVRDNAVLYVPESYLFEADPYTTLSEDARTGVDDIGFDFDTGKPMATATAEIRSGLFEIKHGMTVQIDGAGPANGKWLVQSIRGSFVKPGVTVTLVQPRPVLPEPEESGGGADGEMDSEQLAIGALGEGQSVSSGPDTSHVSPYGGGGQYIWPTSGVISSGFGMRNGQLHAGVDIACPIGTPVVAARAGVVIFAGAASGYGQAIYIKHTSTLTRYGHSESDVGTVITRYGHISQILCARGQQVDQGTLIAKSGNEGHSTGPHLHFEIRPNDQPTDPVPFLPKGGPAPSSPRVQHV